MAVRKSKRQDLPSLSAGRKFKEKPDQAFCARFRAHIMKHGTPVGFPGLCWTKPAPDDPPKPFLDFATPETLRSRVGMSPCPICSPHSPKYFDGKLCWSPGDKRVRAIGHECGHDFYDGESYGIEVREYEQQAAEAAARAYLSERFPLLAERVMRARFMAEDIKPLLRARDELVATITKRATQEMLRSLNAQGCLFVEVDSGVRDGQGRRLAARETVTLPVQLDGLKAQTKSVEELAQNSVGVGRFIVLRREPHPLWRDKPSQDEALHALSRVDAIALEGVCRKFEASFDEVEGQMAALFALLATPNLIQLSKWGCHLHSPTPFWISATASSVTAGKGPHTKVAGRRIVNLPVVPR